MQTDTIKLLRECDVGVKMGIDAIEQMLPCVKDNELRHILEVGKTTHRVIGEDIRERLRICDDLGKDPPRIAIAMSRAKICASMMLCGTERRIACLMTDGCHMGIKILSKHINRCDSADEHAVLLARRLIAAEEYLAGRLRPHL